MKHTIEVFQDSDDVRSGMVQLTITKEGKNCYIYFTLDEWQAFIGAVNKFRYSLKVEDIARPFDSDAHIYLENNPLSCIDQDGTAVFIQFNGCFSVSIYYENPAETPTNKLWESFKRAVNKFTPEMGMGAPRP